MDERLHASGVSTLDPEHENCTTGECVSLQLKQMLMIPIALQERGRKHGVPSDTPDEQVGQNSPDLRSGTMGSESQDGEDKGQGTIAKRECRNPGSILNFTYVN